MADACGADENTGVIEVGPGFGVLTAELASSAERPLPPTLNENPCVSLHLGTGALRPSYRPFFLVLLLAVRCLI